MTREPGPVPPPRLLPERPLPPYTYHPGRTPHPTRDPGGHSVGEAAAAPPAPDPADWRAAAGYLYGIDLFNHGYYWEAHEAWEGLWAAFGRSGATATFLQGLINLAAIGFKVRLGNPRGVRANAATAARLLREAAERLGAGRRRFMGLDVAALAGVAETWRDGRRDGAFDVVLRPE